MKQKKPYLCIRIYAGQESGWLVYYPNLSYCGFALHDGSAFGTDAIWELIEGSRIRSDKEEAIWLDDITVTKGFFAKVKSGKRPQQR